jgi:hypothetical protein
VSAQSVAWVQSMPFSHARWPVHSTVHGMPGGQTIFAGQLFASVHR